MGCDSGAAAPVATALALAPTVAATLLAVAAWLHWLADTVNDELREAAGRIVLDLAGLSFCDSLGLGTLVVLSRTARVQQTYPL
jgi:hypothetical protein